ncbi:hypothetical protein T12_15025 [Trichinella patagoniensis]|uniref:Fibronectin type-III domain-containing protein n=1 Tax=Trichinella patagoniensis TaxID=990121 RepID=A0A0V0Z5Z3_9BILA|nr:hypothetical protein T12_12606 [Trichinella patagoniensis]KRY07498.1 hypothetical protein T12_15025 [Trichinella patagoniensis]
MIKILHFMIILLWLVLFSLLGSNTDCSSLRLIRPHELRLHWSSTDFSPDSDYVFAIEETVHIGAAQH